MPQVGIAGNIQEVYGSQVWANWFALGPQARNLKTWWNYEEWLGGDFNTNGLWYRAVNGTGDAYPTAGLAGRPGRLFMVAAAVNDYGSMVSGGLFRSGFRFGSGTFTYETEMTMTQLSDAVDEFELYFGFGDTLTGDQVDGAYFRYDRTTSINWLACTASNSVRTETDTGIVVVAGSYAKLKVVVDATAANAYFFVNGVLVATNAANIPTGAGRETGGIHLIRKTVGVNARPAYIDWTWVHIDLTASR